MVRHEVALLADWQGLSLCLDQSQCSPTGTLGGVLAARCAVGIEALLTMYQNTQVGFIGPGKAAFGQWPNRGAEVGTAIPGGAAAWNVQLNRMPNPERSGGFGIRLSC